MHISISEAQGQLLELVRRAGSGEKVILTHEGEIVAELNASGETSKAWRLMTPEQRLQAIRGVVAKIPPLKDGGPDAAHSQDFLYDENGLPA